MTRLIASHIRTLKAYEPGKPEDELRRELGLDRIVKLASNENAWGPSPRVLEAARETPWALHRYPDPRAHDLRQALATHHGVDPSELVFGNGSNEIIDLLCRVCANRGDHVVFGHPSFACYRIGAVAQELAHTAVPLRDLVTWSADDLLDAIVPETRLLFVANPNNPTGSYLPASALEQLVRQVREDVLVVIDEAYVEYADASDFRRATELRDLRERLAILRTFSKAYGLASLRVGYAIAPAEVVFDLNRLRAPYNVGTLGQHLACIALDDAAHVDSSVRACIAERTRLTAALRERGMTVTSSQANFVLLHLPVEGRRVYEALLREGVIVRPMPPPIERTIRVSVGLPVENDRFLEALDPVLQGLA